MRKISKIESPKKFQHIARSVFWFVVGFLLSASIVATSWLIYFQNHYKERAIPGVFIESMYVGEKTRNEIIQLFERKNEAIAKNTFTFVSPDTVATLSAKELDIGINSRLLADQALSVGKSGGLASNIYTIFNSYLKGVFFPVSYTYNADKLKTFLAPLASHVYLAPVDALFTVENNRVIAFRESKNGKSLDIDSAQNKVGEEIPRIVQSHVRENISLTLDIKILEPTVTTEKANNFGIVEVIGEGHSTFYHSIPNRVDNIVLATSRVNGVLVAPGETFSFVKYLGDVTRETGFKEAYVIQNGKTVLGDGGGVCQVSTTLFRAILNAGLPVAERHAHAYRVGYYEQDSPPGLDATVFYPNIDLKFKNDTGNYILIQALVDPANYTLSFLFYGKRDGRVASLSNSIVTNQKPAPPPLYQDDATLLKGEVKQIDFEAAGADVRFTRTVTRNGTVILADTYTSHYAPWQAIFMRGTK